MVTVFAVLIYKIHLFFFFTSLISNINKINEWTYVVETQLHTHIYIYILSYVGFVFTVNTINLAQDVCVS